MLRPGVRESDVVAATMKLLFELGSEHVEAINAISGDRCNPHPHTFSDRLLRPGDQAFFDIIHSFMGYRTCYYRTFNVGYATPAQLDAYKQCREWLDAAIDLVRPGVTTDRIAEVWPEAERIGMRDEHAAFGLQFGHGLGVGLYEAPMISRLHSFDDPVELEVGMVFALETYCAASDGRSAARIEEEVIVTPTGPEVITRFPAADLLVTGRTYVRGVDIVDGTVVRGATAAPSSRSRTVRRETVAELGRAAPVEVADGGGGVAERTLIKGGTVITRRPGDRRLLPDRRRADRGRRIVEVAREHRRRGRGGDRRDRLPRPARHRRHASPHLAVAVPQHRLRLDARAYFTGLHGTMSGLYRAGGHLRGQPARRTGGARFRDHDAARLVSQSQHARTYRRGGRCALRLGRARGVRPRRRLPALAAGRARSSIRPMTCGVSGRALLPRDDQLVTLYLAPRGNQFATIEVDAARLGAGEGARDPDQLPFRRRRVGQEPADRALAGARDARPDMTFVHCNSLADDELKMMADAGCTASVSPDIELQMGHGWPATGRLLDVGIRPSLSIDVCSSNGGHMFGTMRATIGTRARLRQRGRPRAGRPRSTRSSSPAATCWSSPRSRVRARAAWTRRSAASPPASEPT